MTLERVNRINDKFQKSLKKLELDEDTEAKEYLNKFIGRNWFK